VSWGFLAPKKPRWLAGSGIAAAAATLLFLVLHHIEPWDPGRAGGLGFGILASLLFLLEVLYPLRRRLMGWPFGSAQRWIQLHIYGGGLAFLFVLYHAGFRWPSGTMGWLLLILSFWATASGLAGVWLQKWAPAAMAVNLQVEALFERIPDLVSKLQEEADKALDGSSEILERFYRTEIRPAFSGVTSSWSYLVDIRGDRERRLAPFERMSRFLAEEERPKLNDLKAIYTEKMELDAQYSVQRVLRQWVWIHVPPSIVLFGLMLFHIWVNLVY
jgi:hypothetical protein